MRTRPEAIWLVLLLLTFPVSCRRKSFDEEKAGLVGQCPHLPFFQAAHATHLVDSYTLEARYLECRRLLDSSSLTYGTEEIRRVIELRKWRTLDGFAACLENTREFGWFRDPKEPYPSRLGACLHQVMVAGVRSEPSDAGKDGDPAAGPRHPRGPDDSTVWVGIGIGHPIQLPSLGRGVPVDTMDWDAICRFTLEELDAPQSQTPRPAVSQETLKLMSRECHRLAGKLRTAAVTDSGIRNLALALFEGEDLPLFRQELDAAVAAVREGGRGASEDRGGDGRGPMGRPGQIGNRGLRMREGAAQVTGNLDPNEVRAVIRAHRNEVHHCYQKGLLQNDKLAGNVRVVFTLNSAGRAPECRIEENLAVESVGDCICNRLQKWRFPQPEGGLAKVSYSWTLQPGETSPTR
jgi:hypothetical protein